MCSVNTDFIHVIHFQKYICSYFRQSFLVLCFIFNENVFQMLSITVSRLLRHHCHCFSKYLRTLCNHELILFIINYNCHNWINEIKTIVTITGLMCVEEKNKLALICCFMSLRTTKAIYLFI